VKGGKLKAETRKSGNQACNVALMRFAMSKNMLAGKLKAKLVDP
jgi:hypothetical protein